MIEFKKILLVDDDEDDRAFFLEVLESIDATVVCITAQNGKEALDKLQNDLPQPDIIFLDLNMPLMNGREFLSAIREYKELRRIPIIILTTSSEESIKRETARLGARGFMTKPDKFYEWESTLIGFFNNPNLESFL